MPPPKDPPAAAEQAARIIALLSSEPATHGRRTADALAAQHVARRRRPRARQSPPQARPASPAGPSSRTYAPDGPTGSRVFDAFLNELSGPAAGGLRAVDISRIPDARLAMLLFDVARRYLPRVVNALGDPSMAMELLPLVDPSPDGRDPHLYTHAAAAVSGHIGVIARDFEHQRALLAQGRGDRALARSILAALAGRILAQAAEILGPQVHEDVARALESKGEVRQSLPRDQRRRAPVRRSGGTPLEDPRRPASKTG